MDDMFRSTSSPVQGRYASDQVTRGATGSFGPRSLETFVDLGLSDRQIARYFQTSETQIVSLRRHYGLS
jgi:hypothetical protein